MKILIKPNVIKTGWLPFLLLYTSFLFAQEKGATPLSPPPSGGDRGEVYAVVVGISDYQDEGIPDLRFADRDAEAFANFLRSPAGGSLDGDHLKVLLNAGATQAQFAAALDWLWEVAGAGDQVIIYFSGHGDVEAKSITQPGYLLCWDAPSRVYMAGGAFNVRDLNDVVSTLSIQNKTKVMLITDACRSGTLAGSTVGGAQATASSLAKQYANEVKILSCQPNEYSIEGEQWGGGRGAFSYHLVDGLYGLADANGDHSVSLFEIGRYLEDHVTVEVVPQVQSPFTVGDRWTKLADVFPDLMAQLQKSKTEQLITFGPTNDKGIEEQVLTNADSTIRELFRAFKMALKNREFFEPADACADVFYEKLMAEPKVERLHSSIRRSYAAALQDDAQQVLLRWLDNDSRQFRTFNLNHVNKYRLFPKSLRRAAQLLGEEHYMYSTLQARAYFFEACLKWSDGASRQGVLNDFQESLKWQPEAPYAHLFKGFFHEWVLNQKDTAIKEILLASSLAPAWIYPYTALAGVHMARSEYHKADSILALAWQIDSSSAHLFMTLGDLERYRENYPLAESWYRRSIGMNSDADMSAYNHLGIVCMDQGSFQEAVFNFQQAIALDKDTIYIGYYFNLAIAYEVLDEYEKLEELHKSMVMWYPFETQWEERNASNIYFDMSRLCAPQNMVDVSFGYLEKSFSSAILPEYYPLLLENEGFENLRAEKDRWNRIMKKYFPEQYKD